jgi:demethylmenaquinone methyltransferase/2-methoxy-6-polyprenyl-1,4-benzoquinol methylase
MSIDIPKNQSWQMFNRIARRYDLLNGILSFGLHHHWRQRMCAGLSEARPVRLLDLATGTGDVAIALTEAMPKIQKTIGLDLADNMLDIGRVKVQQKGLNDRIELVHGDACAIDYPDASFNAISMAFGIRNVPDPLQAMKEMNRVLTEHGRAVILEFSMPKNPVIRWGHLMYLRYGVPAIGWLVSGNYKAYKYLNQSIEDFPYGDDFCHLMRKAGFSAVRCEPLLFGVATLYIGLKDEL